MNLLYDTAVVEVRPCGQYQIWVRFADGTEGTVDLAGYLEDPSWEGNLKKWRSPGLFDTVKPGGLGVVWDSGGDDNISLASDRLYATVRDLKPEDMNPELYATRVVEAEALDKYRVQVRFADGTEGVVDLADFAGKEAFRQWDQPGGWESMRVSHDTLEWGPSDPTEVIDFCPEMLYSRALDLPRDHLRAPEFAKAALRRLTR